MKITHADPDHLFLPITQNWAMRLFVGFVMQGHIEFDQNLRGNEDISPIKRVSYLMIHSISSAPFICENHIQRRLAPQIVIINFTFAGKGVF